MRHARPMPGPCPAHAQALEASPDPPTRLYFYLKLVDATKRMTRTVQLIYFLIKFAFSTLWTNGAVGDVYYIGTGRYDITGPAVETEMVCVCQVFWWVGME